MIPDLVQRFKKLVDLERDPLVVPKPDVYGELAAEWFGVPVATLEQRQRLMKILRQELDREELFNAMNSDPLKRYTK